MSCPPPFGLGLGLGMGLRSRSASGGAPAGPWTPADITTEAWFDASDAGTITESGGLVSQWDDKSGNGRHVVQGNGADQPAVITAGMNGLDVLEFAGRTKDMDGILPIDAQWAIVVLQYNAAPAFSQALGAQFSGGGDAYTVQYRGDLDADRWQNPYFTNGNPEAILGAAVNVNPTVVVHDGMSLSAFDFQIGGDRGLNGRGWDGYISEVIYGDFVLDTDTRQKLEGYLAWKWGTVAALPSDHPYRFDGSLFGYETLWTPAELATKGWFDAAAPSTITESGGAVSQWDDKSGNSNHATQGVGSLQPATGTYDINGVNALRFAGDELENLSSRFGLGANPDLMVFAVFEKAAGTEGRIFGIGQEADAAGGILAIAQGNNFGWRYNNGNENYSATGATIPYLGVWQRTSGGDYESAQFFLNGTEDAPTSNGNPTGVPTDTTARFFIGNFAVGGPADRYFEGSLGELIVIESNDPATRQLVEGYLAWKWGIQANLDVSHPYKSTPPTV